jgi:DNA-binding NarL/FixJ family response regulator
MPKRVLIADDSSTVRDIIKVFLALRGDLEVCGEASDGVDAVEKASASKPDLILLDFAMPRMNGAQAASTLKKLMPEVPIIFFTMYSENIGQYLAAIGVDAILAKSDGLTELIKAVDAVLSRSSGPVASPGFDA